MSDPFGTILGPEAVIDAAVEQLKLWMPTYLAELERQASLAKGTLPRPQNYHGGIDWGSYEGGPLPDPTQTWAEVMCLVKPSGPPEKGASGYTQGYELQVGCVTIGSQLNGRAEDEARVAASYLGAASQLLVQGERSALGSLNAERLVMIAAPEVSLLDPEQREIVHAVTGFAVWVPNIIGEFAGPVGPTPEGSLGYEGPEEPFAPGPVVTTTDLTVKGEPV